MTRDIQKFFLSSPTYPFEWYFSFAGDSAGGNLAAAVSLRLRDMKIEPQPKLQVLIYPVTQSVDFMLPSYITNQYDPFLSKEAMVAFTMNYAGIHITTLNHILTHVMDHIILNILPTCNKHHFRSKSL